MKSTDSSKSQSCSLDKRAVVLPLHLTADIIPIFTIETLPRSVQYLSMLITRHANNCINSEDIVAHFASGKLTLGDSLKATQ